MIPDYSIYDNQSNTSHPVKAKSQQKILTEKFSFETFIIFNIWKIEVESSEIISF
jgi:hypothetical protein